MRVAHSVIAVLVFLTATLVQPATIINDDNLIQSSLAHWENEPLTAENVARAIVELQIQHPEIVFKQAVIESGNFTSRLCTKSNNLFGMRKPRTRETFAVGKTKSSYAVFKHWSHSVADYKLWQGTELIKNYQKFLARKKYSVNPHYVKSLNTLKLDPTIQQILKSS